MKSTVQGWWSTSQSSAGDFQGYPSYHRFPACLEEGKWKTETAPLRRPGNNIHQVHSPPIDSDSIS